MGTCTVTADIRIRELVSLVS